METPRDDEPVLVPAGCQCPRCGENRATHLTWLDDLETTRCLTCGAQYQPETNYEFE